MVAAKKEDEGVNLHALVVWSSVQVMALTTCVYSVITASRISQTFRTSTPVAISSVSQIPGVCWLAVHKSLGRRRASV